jgi:DNA-binding transcriptional regulator YdaS (Cro superfamily)
MTLGNKFEEYFTRTGISGKWFAEKIGIHPNSLYGWIAGSRPIPQKYWKKIVSVSGGAITLCDLMKVFIKDQSEIDVIPGKTPDTCTIILK